MIHCPNGGATHKAYYVRLNPRVIQCCYPGCDHQFSSQLKVESPEYESWGTGGISTDNFLETYTDLNLPPNTTTFVELPPLDHDLFDVEPEQYDPVEMEQERLERYNERRMWWRNPTTTTGGTNQTETRFDDGPAQ